MNDGLRDVIQRAFADCAQKHEGITIAYHSGARQIVEEAVRAWLALPPSEDEIEAAGNALFDYESRPDGSAAERWEHASSDTRHMYGTIATQMLVASRAVLARPPEKTP